ncbi:MAG: SMC-Scp complex subunit ScpB [Burkholderiales bacterium]
MKTVIEAVLLVTQEPLPFSELKKLFDEEPSTDALRRVLDELRRDWQGRGVELTHVASGWRFRARPEIQKFIERVNPQRPPRYSRAVLETLAIIAYRQPCTRGDIEEIRGVVVSPGIIKALEARGWIDVVGHKEVPGRPELFATTRAFLDDLNLSSLEELPPLDDLGSLVETAHAAALPAAATDAPDPEMIAAPDSEVIAPPDPGVIEEPRRAVA